MSRTVDNDGGKGEDMMGTHAKKMRLMTLADEPDVVLVVIGSQTTDVLGADGIAVIPTTLAEKYWAHPGSTRRAVGSGL